MYINWKQLSCSACRVVPIVGKLCRVVWGVVKEGIVLAISKLSLFGATKVSKLSLLGATALGNSWYRTEVW